MTPTVREINLHIGPQKRLYEDYINCDIGKGRGPVEKPLTEQKGWEENNLKDYTPGLSSKRRKREATRQLDKEIKIQFTKSREIKQLVLCYSCFKIPTGGGRKGGENGIKRVHEESLQFPESYKFQGWKKGKKGNRLPKIAGKTQKEKKISS